jgi:hypothetical protein
MPSNLLTYPKFKAFTISGAPLANGTVSTFLAGTTTPLTTYADAAQITPNPNPITLDANGECLMYVGIAPFKVVLKDSLGATVWTVDNYYPTQQVDASNAQTQWVYVAPTPGVGTPVSFIFTSATQFQINAGRDLTGAPPVQYGVPYAIAGLSVGDRIRTQNTAGVVYSTITAITSAIPNVITVVNDGNSVIDAGISVMWMSPLRYANPSYLDPRTALCATKNGNQVGFAASTKIVTWNAASPDPLGEFGTGPNVVIKYPGRYLVTAQANISQNVGVNTAIIFGIGDNVGTQFQGNYCAPPVLGLSIMCTFSKVVQCIAGQNIAMWLTGDANTLVEGNNTSINVVRIP